MIIIYISQNIDANIYDNYINGNIYYKNLYMRENINTQIYK